MDRKLGWCTLIVFILPTLNFLTVSDEPFIMTRYSHAPLGLSYMWAICAVYVIYAFYHEYYENRRPAQKIMLITTMIYVALNYFLIRQMLIKLKGNDIDLYVLLLLYILGWLAEAYVFYKIWTLPPAPNNK